MILYGILNAVLDTSIVFSFDRSGFRRHRAKFDNQDLNVDMTSKVCLVTGANSGIGLATSKALARLGARVHLLCRNAQRGEEALLQIQRETGSKTVFLHLVDISDMRSIRSFSRQLKEQTVDVLVHNAGVLPGRRVETADGLELTLATNLVGPFLLTQLLIGKLKAAEAARVIFVSSGGMYTQRLDVSQLAPHAGSKFDGVVAYARTKRALTVLSELFSERYSARGTTFNSMHPGWADTPAVRTSLPLFHQVTRLILRTPDEGADTVIWLAVSHKADDESGKFWFDREPRATYYLPWTRESREEREALWEALERWTGATANTSTDKVASARAKVE